VKAATVEVIYKWFNYLQIPAIQRIPPEYKWNIDKAGLIEGLGSNSYVIRSVKRRLVISKKPNSRTWISFIKCISALRALLDPVVIYKGAFVQ